MRIVSDTYIDFIIENFFKEEKFVCTNHSVGDWYEKPRMIQPREVFSHFKGKYYVGMICRNTPIDVLIFDIDSHSIEAKRTLKNRVNRVKNKFKNPDFIYSSPNSGYHLYYHLDRKYDPLEIQTIVKRNIKTRSGEIEFFPNGRGIRLLGGQNCMLLDHNLRQTNINPEEYIQSVWELNSRFKLGELNSKPFIEFSNSFILECENLLKQGLLFQGTRNDSLLKLNRYLQGYKNYSREKTAEILINWISNKNNGLSKDWTKYPRTVIKQIHAIVNRFDESKFKEQSDCFFPRHLLSENDLQSIKNLSLELAKSFGIDWYLFNEYLIDLIAYCKYHQVQCIIEIPRGVFQNCKNGSGKRYIQFKDALQKSGVLVLKENYSTAFHKCIKYKLLDELC